MSDEHLSSMTGRRLRRWHVAVALGAALVVVIAATMVLAEGRDDDLPERVESGGVTAMTSTDGDTTDTTDQAAPTTGTRPMPEPEHPLPTVYLLTGTPKRLMELDPRTSTDHRSWSSCVPTWERSRLWWSTR
jgi:hypothetical protein